MTYKQIEVTGITLSLIVCLGLGFLIGRQVEKLQTPMGAYTQYGLPGIYNNPAQNLANEDGSAWAVDSEGKLIISTTTVVTATLGT